MKTMQTAVAQYLQQATGIRAVQERSKAAGYPVLTVSAEETGAVLLAGGAQCEHSYQITVHAVSDRERDGKTQLLSRLISALTHGIPMGTRVLHPLDIKTQGDALTFAVTLCVAVPPKDGTAADWMETISVAMR